MAVAVIDYPLVTVEDAAIFLKIPTSDLVTSLVNRATEYCEWYCNRTFAAREFESLRFAAQRDSRLRPRATPIDVEAEITIDVNGAVQTVWRTEADGDPSLALVVVGGDVPGEPNYFWRSGGWLSTSAYNPFPTRITYTGGFVTIPGQLQDAAFLVIENLYRAQEKKLTEIDSISGPVQPSLSFSGALIPMKAKQILDSYRLEG